MVGQPSQADHQIFFRKAEKAGKAEEKVIKRYKNKAFVAFYSVFPACFGWKKAEKPKKK